MGIAGIVFALCAAGAWVASAFLSPVLAPPARPAFVRPTPHPYSAFSIEVRRPGSADTALTITTDNDCLNSLLPSGASAVCSVAINEDPAVIGGAALGELNLHHTVAFDALVWRGRIDDDPGVCERGGLLGDLLDSCVKTVSAASYAYQDGDVSLVPTKGP